MADTIINTPDRTGDNSALGLVVALIIVAAIIVAGFVWYRHGAPGAPNSGATNINVTVPSGGASGATGGGGGTGATQ